MRAMITSINNFPIILRKILKVSSKLKVLNFFYLFMIFRMLFLIIYENSFITYSYLKLFILLKSAYNFFRKKLCYSISAFFYIMRVARHLKQLLSSVIILEQ